MKISDVNVGTELTVVDSTAIYRVTEINADMITLANVRLCAGMDINIEDLPIIFKEVQL